MQPARYLHKTDHCEANLLARVRRDLCHDGQALT